MGSLVMSWNTKDDRLACRWRELERDSDGILHDLQPDDPSAGIPVEVRRLDSNCDPLRVAERSGMMTFSYPERMQKSPGKGIELPSLFLGVHLQSSVTCLDVGIKSSSCVLCHPIHSTLLS
jgi:hypothetical protein